MHLCSLFVCVCMSDLVRLEVDVAQMKDRGQQSVDAVLLLRSETQDVHGVQQTPEVLPIILPLDSTIPSLQSRTHTSYHTHPYNVINSNKHTLGLCNHSSN